MAERQERDQDITSAAEAVEIRLYRLTPWLVRALIPARRSGSYVLYRASRPSYVGRSDACLRSRLILHAYAHRGEFFSFQTHHSVVHGFTVECAIYHVLRRQLTNLIHPDSPDNLALRCPFCRSGWATTTPLHLRGASRHPSAGSIPKSRRIT